MNNSESVSIEEYSLKKEQSEKLLDFPSSKWENYIQENIDLF